MTKRIKLGLDRLPPEQEKFWVVEFSNYLGKYVSVLNSRGCLVPEVFTCRRHARDEAKRWRDLGSHVRVKKVSLKSGW